MKAKNTKTPPKGNRARKPAKLPYTVRNDGPPPTEEEERAHEAHVARLIKEGWVTPGKGGPLPEELFRPGPRFKGDLKTVMRWIRDDS